jgi:hypothetical protein
MRGLRAAAGLAFGCGCLLVWSSCTRGAARTLTCGSSATFTAGVAWPGIGNDFDRSDAVAKRRFLGRARALVLGQTTDPALAVSLSRFAAQAGDLNLAVDAARAELAAGTGQPEVRGLAAAALLARYLHNGGAGDLLDAGEILADGGYDASARCNRLLVLQRLGLSYRLAADARNCPCREALDLDLPAGPQFPLDGRRHSADQLAPSQLNEIEPILAREDRAHAVQAMRYACQAWRAWFERGALDLWCAASGAVDRAGVEKRVEALARLYASSCSNPAPLRLWEQLAAVPLHDLPAAREGLAHWQDGAAALSAYQPDRVMRELDTARRNLAFRLPALLPTIDLTLAAARFHLGDDRGMLDRALAVRHRVPKQDQPWAWARALWLEALALQARADWSESLRRAEESARIYTETGEPANAGYQEVLRGIALDAEGADQPAALAYLTAVRRIHDAGDTRLLAGALALFARQQSRAGHPHVGVELQRESTVLDGVDGAPQLVAESKAVLAEQLFRAGEFDQGKQVLREARETIRQIGSAQPRRRAEGILAQVEASGARDTDPGAAELALGRFLSEFAAFGERHFRAEALVGRAEARIRLGKLHGAEDDLAAALGEIAMQSARLEDRVLSVALLDRAREALELLVQVSLRRPEGADHALSWIERLRREQIGLGLGRGRDGLLQGPNLCAAPKGTCITEYWTAPTELFAWTSCDGAPPHLDRAQVRRDELVRELGRMRSAAQRGELADLRRHSIAASSWLVVPIEKSLAAAVSWTVIPDALFPAAPMAWLTLNGRFLFQDRSVNVAPSWSQLSVERSHPPPLWRGFGLGDPSPSPAAGSLPQARVEAERLGAFFPGSIAKVGAAATWTALRQQAGGFNLLHLATHISSGSRVPLSSRLELAPESLRPDGRVSADEVAQQHFRGLRLVVVASCSSAAAAPVRIAGSLDFARAFLKAGADEVLGTLWDVPDREVSAAIFDFYNGLRVGLSPSQALARVWAAGLGSQADAATFSVRSALQLSRMHP